MTKRLGSSEYIHEHTPLITGSSHNRQCDLKSTPNPKTKDVNVILLLCIVLVLIQCGDEIAQPPQARIAEAILCYRHYEVTDPGTLLADRAHVGPGAIGGVTESLCKIEDVQSQLSSLRGYQTFFDGGPSLLLALPFGWAADKYGRKPLLFLGALSFVLRSVWIQTVYWFWQTFDIRWVWASSLHGLMAGSSPVVSALFFVIVADVMPEEGRSKLFLRIGGVNLLASVFMPLLSAWLMLYSPSIPSLAGTLLHASSMLVILSMPETLNCRQSPRSAPSTPTRESGDTPTDPIPPLTLKQKWQHTIKPFTSDWRISALTTTFLIHLPIADSTPLQLQYISKRYNLPLSSATTRLTLRALANILLFFLILPFLAHLLRQNLRLSNPRTDLYLSRASMTCWALGLLLFGLAPTPATAAAGMSVMALGYGSMFLIRSFLTPLVPARDVARLYGFVSAVDTLGGMLGAPLLAGLFNRGLEVGGVAVGLPFCCLGVACAGFAVGLCVVGVRKGEERGGLGEADGG